MEASEIALSIGAGSLSMKVDESITIQAAVSTTTPARLYTIRYETTNPQVVTVSAAGLLKAIANGSATIKCTATLLDTGGSASAVVNVSVGGGAPAGLPSPQPVDTVPVPTATTPPATAGTTALRSLDASTWEVTVTGNTTSRINVFTQPSADPDFDWQQLTMVGALPAGTPRFKIAKSAGKWLRIGAENSAGYAPAKSDPVALFEGAAPPPPPPPPPTGSHVPNFGSGAQLLYATSYTSRDERDAAGGLWYLQYPGSNNTWNPTFLAPVQAPWDASRKAVRAIIHKGDNWEGLGYPRSEMYLSKFPQIDAGARYFISFGFMFAGDGKSYLDNNSSEMLGLLQLHHPTNVGSPPMAFYLSGKTLSALCRGGSASNMTNTKTYPLFPVAGIPTDRLVAVDVEYVPRNDANAVLKVWIDGVQVVNHTGPCAYANSGNAGYFKQGLYDYFKTVPNTLTAYFDDFVLRKQ